MNSLSWKLGLASTRLASRRNRLGGSDARVIMSGDPERVYQLWQEKRGEREPDDLSDVLEAVMGLWTEELNRLWFTRRTGRDVFDAGKSCDDPRHSFLSCTLDGKTYSADGSPAVFEAKHVNPFAFDLNECVARYQPQMQHYMAVNRVRWAVLSVFVGTFRWEYTEVEADPFYQAELRERMLAFWEAVQSGTPPVELPTIEPPVPPERLLSMDMTGNNEWASLAASWIETKSSAALHSSCEKKLKELVSRETGIAHGHGITIKRDASGRLRLKEGKSK